MSGSDMLVEVLKRFAVQGEPKAILAVWTDPNGCVNFKTNCANTHTVGMGVYVAVEALIEIIKNPQEITRAGPEDAN
jgi:hypothetical protein